MHPKVGGLLLLLSMKGKREWLTPSRISQGKRRAEEGSKVHGWSNQARGSRSFALPIRTAQQQAAGGEWRLIFQSPNVDGGEDTGMCVGPSSFGYSWSAQWKTGRFRHSIEDLLGAPSPPPIQFWRDESEFVHVRSARGKCTRARGEPSTPPTNWKKGARNLWFRDLFFV